MGLVNYHRAHIKDFAKYANPLYALLDKKTPFVWNKQHEEGFNYLKSTLISSPVLAFPRPNEEPFILDTDASDLAIGAELIQLQDGQERMIGFSSFTLSPTQRNYCTTKEELLAVVRFTRQFRHYLLGRQFYVRTDHGSLTWLMRFKNINGMLARWIEELSQYDMVILHRKGTEHVNADARSRIPEDLPFCNCYTAGCNPENLPCAADGCMFCPRIHEQWARFEDDVDNVIPLSVRQVSIKHNRHHSLILGDLPGEKASQSFIVRQTQIDNETDDEPDEPGLPEESVLEETSSSGRPVLVKDLFSTKYNLQQLREEQLKDSDLRQLIGWKEMQSDPPQSELQLSSRAVKHLWASPSLLELENGVLYYRWVEEHDSRLLLLVPLALRDEAMHYCHNVKLAGHPGSARTYAKLIQVVFWHGMRMDCAIFAKACPECSRQKKPSRQAKATLGSYHAGVPVERIHIDILGPFSPSSSGNEYILMLVCQYTKWIEAYPLSNCRTETVADVIINNFISRFGCPAFIHSDQGSNFTSSLFLAICDLLEIAKTRTTPYRPCSNGQVERYNRTLLAMMRCYLKNGVTDWDKDLSLLTASIRAIPNRQTGFSPNIMMFGREVAQPLNLVFGNVNVERKEEPQFLHDLRDRLQRVHHQARENIRASQQYQQHRYNQGARQTKYVPGDLVLVMNKAKTVGVSAKLLPIFKGPLLVTEVLSPVLLRIRDRRKSRIVHHDMVKKCHDGSIPLWLRRMRNDLFAADKKSLETTNLASQSSQSPASVDPFGDGSTLANEDIEDSTWIQCDYCQKWRRISKDVAEQFPDNISWNCQMNPDTAFGRCTIPEEDTSDWVDVLEDKDLTYKTSKKTEESGIDPGPSVVSGVQTRVGRKVKPPSRFTD